MYSKEEVVELLVKTNKAYADLVNSDYPRINKSKQVVEIVQRRTFLSDKVIKERSYDYVINEAKALK